MAKQLFTIYVTDTVPVEIRPPKNARRSWISVTNKDANDIWYEEDTVPSANDATVIGTQQTLFQGESNPSVASVPKGSVWIRGTVTTPQRVQIEQG